MRAWLITHYYLQHIWFYQDVVSMAHHTLLPTTHLVLPGHSEHGSRHQRNWTGIHSHSQIKYSRLHRYCLWLPIKLWSVELTEHVYLFYILTLPTGQKLVGSWINVVSMCMWPIKSHLIWFQPTNICDMGKLTEFEKGHQGKDISYLFHPTFNWNVLLIFVVDFNQM